MSKQPTEPAAPIRISTNTIWEGKFYTAGEPLPFERIADLPENLQPLVVTSEPEAEEPNEPRGSFQTGVIYEMTPDGRLGRALRRKVERQVAELEAAAQENDWIEEQVATAELPPEIAKDLQEEHEAAIAFAKAQAEADARRSDEVSDAAAAELPRMYVKRGGRHYAPADKARLLPGENVFIRQPADGRFECIGITDGDAQLPDLPIEL
jgi:hypothetical protein